jgi:hypothetical protein
MATPDQIITQNIESALPSWRQVPIVWMIIAIPLSSVIVGFIMLWLAISSNDGLVFDDYHQQGKEINRVLARDAMASSLDLAARIELLPESHRLEISLSHRQTINLPDTLLLRFLHPTRAGEDVHLTLQRNGTSKYLGDFPRLSAGKWIVQLETGEWRINGFAQMPGSNLIRLEAQ